MRCRSSSLAPLILLLLVFVGAAPTQIAQQNVSDEEYSVYSAILRGAHQADKRKIVVIIRTTSRNELTLPGSDDQKRLMKRLSPLTKEALKSYNARNNTQRELENKFRIGATGLLVNETDISNIFKQSVRDNWKSFYEQFPDSGGFIKFSGVGFDAESSQALVFVSHYCGGLCASGTYYLLLKVNGEWKIEKEDLIWVS